MSTYSSPPSIYQNPDGSYNGSGSAAVNTGHSVVVATRAPKPILRGAPVRPLGRTVIMTLTSFESNVEVQLQYAPRETSMSGLAMRTERIERPGRSSILTLTGDSDPVFSFTALLGYPDAQTSVEGGLADIEALADSGEPILIGLGSMTTDTIWYITDLSWKSKDRNEMGEVSVAEVEIELGRITPTDIRVFPSSGTPASLTPVLPINVNFTINNESVQPGDIVRRIDNFTGGALTSGDIADATKTDPVTGTKTAEWSDILAASRARTEAARRASRQTSGR